MPGGIRPFRSPRGERGMVLNFPLAPSQDFEPGDPVQLVSQQLTSSPADGTEILVAEFLGFAAESATGVSQVGGTPATTGTENEIRGVIIPTYDQTFITPNLWTAASATTRQRPLGTDIGTILQIAENTGAGGAANEWGLEDSAATLATHATALVIAIYEDRSGNTVTAGQAGFDGTLLGPGDPINADNTTTGVWVEFVIANPNLCQWGLGGA